MLSKVVTHMEACEMINEQSKAIDEVHRRIGRNLLRFQGIEIGLKLILPYIHPEGGAKGAEALRAYRKEHVESKTLGPLFEQFRESIDAPPGFFERSLEDVCDARNKLVHHFYQLPDVNLLKLEGIAQAVEYLDRQFKDAEELSEIIRIQSLVLLLILMERSPALATEYGAHYEKLIGRLPPNFEFIDQGDPTRTTWQTTRIVRLLRQAELSTAKVGDMTLLSRAGRFIKDQSPDLSVKEYGFGSLHQLLRASGLFEVATAEDGKTVLYRSRVSSAGEGRPRSASS